MNTHTPGPWMFDRDTFDILYDDRNGDNVTPRIATVYFDNTEDAQALADARLIAAAPMLLTACVAALDAFSPNNDEEGRAALKLLETAYNLAHTGDE